MGIEKQSEELSKIDNISKEFVLERQKDALPALKVQNSTIFLNPSFKNLPFNIKGGESSDLGMFLTPAPEKYSQEIVNAKIMPEEMSGRSIFLGEFEFEDKEGRQYRDVDLKGTGVFLKLETGEYIVGEVRKRGNNPKAAKGLMDYKSAMDSKDCAEFFISKGIRTNRVIAILELKEMVNKEGDKISINKARETEIIPKEMHPAILVRAFNTKERIDYLTRISSDRERNRALLAINDAKFIVSKELNCNLDNFSLIDYLSWFAKTLGEQIAKIRKIGFYSGNLHPQNITLDCSIADLEGFKVVEKIFSENERDYNYREQLEQHLNLKRGELTLEIIYRSEFDGAKESLNILLRSVKDLTNEIDDEDIQRCVSLYEGAYKKEF